MGELKIRTDGIYRYNGLDWVLDISNFKPGTLVSYHHGIIHLKGEVIKVGKKKVLVKFYIGFGREEFQRWHYPDELNLRIF